MTAATRTVESVTPAASYTSSLEHLQDELARIDLLVRTQVARARDASGSDVWRGLSISEIEVDSLLTRSLGSPPWDLSEVEPSLAGAQAHAARLGAAIAQRVHAATAPLRLVQLAERFELDRFELDVLLIALAPELDLRYERFYAYLHDDVTRKRPSVDLALHLLCRSPEERFAARARFSSDAALVRHGLVKLGYESSRPPLLAFTLKVDDRVVDWLHGFDQLEPKLARHAQRAVPRTHLTELLVTRPLHRQLDRLAEELRASMAPVVYLKGPYGVGKRTVAESLARAVGRDLLCFDAASLEGAADDAVEALLRAAAREAQLADDLLVYLRADLLLVAERPATRAALGEILDHHGLPIVLTGEAARDLRDLGHARAVVCVELGLPSAAAQQRLWKAALRGAVCPRGVDLSIFAARFRLSGGQIHDAAASARGLARLRGGASARVTLDDLSEGCRLHAGRRLEAFARKLSARPSWSELVLPADHAERLREICSHAQHRKLVFERWGFERKLLGGKGLGMLFAGPPGTGKTLAASVIATELGLDIYQIDLSSVVSKWLGETEKHLAKIFDEAERAHVVLFFDEADSLFAKRSEVRDAHDRYANVETSYLLQRVEEYEGVVILASNFRRNIDEAFVRRLRFILDFPLPDERARLRIWSQMFPDETPLSPDVDLTLMAQRFELAGAYIRNIALAAAFLAATEAQPVSQRHLLQSARREYQKLGKMLDESSFRAGTPP